MSPSQLGGGGITTQIYVALVPRPIGVRRLAHGSTYIYPERPYLRADWQGRSRIDCKDTDIARLPGSLLALAGCV